MKRVILYSALVVMSLGLLWGCHGGNDDDDTTVYVINLLPLLDCDWEQGEAAAVTHDAFHEHGLLWVCVVPEADTEPPADDPPPVDDDQPVDDPLPVDDDRPVDDDQPADEDDDPEELDLAAVLARLLEVECRNDKFTPAFVFDPVTHQVVLVCVRNGKWEPTASPLM